MSRTPYKVRSLTAADLGITPANPDVRVLEGDEELWRGALSDFFAENSDGIDGEARDALTEELNATGKFTIGGGSAPLFTIEKVCF